jgi:mono/diheme cytochrome c family protein
MRVSRSVLVNVVAGVCSRAVLSRARRVLVPLPVAGALLLGCGGDRKAPEPVVEGAVPSTAAASTATPSAPASAGAVAYGRCVVCHTATGEGVPNIFPPLAGSEWVTGPAARPIAVVLHGLQGAVTVKGVTYTNAMMAYGTGVPMSDTEVAAVVTHIRSSWGNAASPVSEAEVARVRKATAGRTGPYTQAELERVR